MYPLKITFNLDLEVSLKNKENITYMKLEM
jgi:hypothetical protein